MSLPCGIRYFGPVLLAVTALLAGCRATPEKKEASFLKKGLYLVDKKDYHRALLEFRNAAKVMPKDAEPHYQMGLVLLRMNNVASATVALRRATQLNPKHTDAQLKLSELMVVSPIRSAVEDAARRMQQVLEAAPDTPEASDTLALAEVRLGKGDDAAKRLEETLKKFPSHLHTSVELARLRLLKQDPSGAEQVLRSAVASAPKSSEAALALGQLLIMVRKQQEGEEQVKRSIGLNPKYGAALLFLGKLQLATHRQAEAEQTFGRIAQLPDKQYKPMHAIFLFDQGKHDQAIAEFRTLAQADPDDRTARSRLIAAYLGVNKVSEAQDVLVGALKRNPKDIDALLQRSQLFLQSGKPGEAEKDLREVLRFKPDSVDARFALSGVYRQQGLARSERQELNEVLRRNAKFVPARLALTRSFLRSNEASEALKVLDESPEAQKKVPALILQRNWVLYALNRRSELRAGIDAVLKMARVPEAVLQDGLLRAADKNYGAARAAAEALLKTNPDDVRAAALLVSTYADENQPNKATEALRRIATQRPNSAPLQNLLGQWLERTGDRAGARQAFQSAKAANAASVTADLALARLDIADNQLDAARQRLGTVLRSNPRHAGALFMMAIAEERLGNRAAAITRYRTMLEVDTNNAGAMNNIAYLMALDNPDEALKYAQQAVESSPESAAARDTLGWVYYRKGMYKMALNYLKDAVSKEAAPNRQFHLGMCYLKLGDKVVGESLVTAALKQDPTLSKTEQGW